MVCFGILISLGMLIDGAVVVVEYADRKMSEGFDKKEAYRIAATRMFWPVVVSIMTTLAIFFPLLFWDLCDMTFHMRCPGVMERKDNVPYVPSWQGYAPGNQYKAADPVWSRPC